MLVLLAERADTRNYTGERLPPEGIGARNFNRNTVQRLLPKKKASCQHEFATTL